MKEYSIKRKNILFLKIGVVILSLFGFLNFSLSSSLSQSDALNLIKILLNLTSTKVSISQVQQEQYLPVSNTSTVIHPLTPPSLYKDISPAFNFGIFHWDMLEILSISRDVNKVNTTDTDVVAVLSVKRKFIDPRYQNCPDTPSFYDQNMLYDQKMPSVGYLCARPIEKTEQLNIKILKDTIFLRSWTKERFTLKDFKVGDKIEVYGFQTGEKEIEALIIRLLTDKPQISKYQPVPSTPEPYNPPSTSNLPNFVITAFDVRNNSLYPNSSYDVYLKIKNTGGDYKSSTSGEVVKAAIFVNDIFLNEIPLFSEIKSGEEKEIKRSFIKRRMNESFCRASNNLTTSTTGFPVLTIDTLKVVINYSLKTKPVIPETDYQDNEVRMDFPKNIICGEYYSESLNLPDFIITKAAVSNNPDNPSFNFDVSVSILNNSQNNYISPSVNRGVKITIWAGESGKNTFPIFVDLIDTGIREIKAKDTVTYSKSLLKKPAGSSLCSLNSDKINLQFRVNPNEKRNDYVFQESNFLNNTYVLTVPKSLLCQGNTGVY